MYAVIDTQYRTARSRGRIISQHRSVETATAADSKLQRAVRRRNGQHSYLPTIVCVGSRSNDTPTECDALRSDWVQVDPETGEPVES